MHSAEVHYSSVEVHGIKVFYREAGPADGPPILLLHGFPANRLSVAFRAVPGEYQPATRKVQGGKQ